MARIFVLFNLKPGADEAAYRAWALATDLPVVRALSSIASFDVFAVTGLLGSDAAPPYRFIEVIDVSDMAQFGRDVAQDTMQRVAAEFAAFADPVFLMTQPLDVG